MTEYVYRCICSGKCVDAEKVPIPAAVPTSASWLVAGAVLKPLDVGGLCAACLRHIEHAIIRLPGDVVELFELMEPTLEVRYRKPGMPAAPRVKKHPPLPFREDPVALAQLIDHETDWWADSVAAAAGLGRVRIRRLEGRVFQACKVLAQNMRWLVTLPEQSHPARSVTVGRADGHDPDHTYRGPDDYYTVRNGLEGALGLLRLHEAAEKIAGREPVQAEQLPCPACQRRTLVREHRAGRVVCTANSCHHHMSDDAYERLSRGSLENFLALGKQLREEDPW